MWFLCVSLDDVPMKMYINELPASLYNIIFPQLSKNSVWKWNGAELKYSILKLGA